MRSLLAIVVIALLCSCSSVRLYPVCFFDKVAPENAVKTRHVAKLTAIVRRFDNSAAATDDGRWIVANTSVFSHKELKEIWPAVACIGTVTSGTEVMRNSDCTNFIAEQLETEKFRSFDIKLNAVEQSDEALGVPNVICMRLGPK